MEPDCCWHKEHITVGDCPLVDAGEEALLLDRRKRFLQRCLGCPRFRKDLRAMSGESNGLADLLPDAVEELLALRAETRKLAEQVEARNRETRFLHEVGLVLQTSMDKDEVIAMALTAITAGKGFGLNRAILLLVDKERQQLYGHLAVGPRSREDAGLIWQEIVERDYPLREMAQLLFEEKMTAEKEKFRDLLERLTVPLIRRDHLFVRTLNGHQSRFIRDLDREPDLDRSQVEALGVKEIVLVPLRSKNRRIGLLLADNIITGHPIAEKDLHSLETFALPVSFAIERAALYERLQEELEKVTEANLRLRDQQELILRMEKMALVGNLTANIAHSIRNPLTIIGGFARTLIKNMPPEDGKRPYAESIMRETRRLEEVLEEVLSYAESQHPTLDLWDINRLVTEVFAGLRDDLEIGDVSCRLDLAPTLPLVKVDFKKISYCLRSIVRRALAAMPQGGEMNIRTVRAEDELHIILTHNGGATPRETVENVNSAASSAVRQEQDSGLGLALCARILEDHNADLEIRTPGETGTIFIIRLRLPKEEIHGSTAGG